MSLFFYNLLHVITKRRWGRTYLPLGAVAVLTVGALPAHAALDRIVDFALLDDRGEFHQLSRYRHQSALVMMSYDASCAEMDAVLADYQALAARYREAALTFVLLDSRDLGREITASYGLSLPLLEDDGQLVSEALGIASAGEVRVLNPERLSLFYAGSVGPALEATLSAVLDQTLEDTRREAIGDCVIEFPQRAAHAESPPSYANDVAPIVIDNCSECHRQGGVGPFALDSYIMMLGWSPMIKEVLLNKRMPPTQIDPYVGHSNSARYLSKDELQTLIHWIDNGAPQGDPERDPLAELAAAEADAWRLGEPDFVVKGPPIAVPPTGVMDYVYDEVDLPFDEDRWLRAVQYRAGDASVLHHLMTFVTTPEEDFWGPERNQESVARRFVEGYAPGKPNVRVYEPGTGLLIPQGHRLAMQFHYVTNGQSTTDETELGLYFSSETGLIEQQVQAVSTRFVLPPNEPNFALEAEHVFAHDVVITGVRARMNYRGKKMKFLVEAPDGTQQELLSVPAYNYGWQPHYLLDTQVAVPAGHKIRVVGAFDNSVSNPTNPDPSKEVTFSLDSWDEMFTGYFSFHRAP